MKETEWVFFSEHSDMAKIQSFTQELRFQIDILIILIY